MDLGRLIFYSGIFLAVAGAILVRFPNLMDWFGRLPGDFRFQNGRFTLFIPVASMVVVSTVLSLGTFLVGKVFSK